jgi:putative pyruvate formate lyase activating enzyme
LREKGLDLPIVYNLSGYQSVEMLKAAADYANIYLPDFKYSDSFLAGKLSKCPDYPGVALEAIAEMVLQKGFLDACLTRSGTAKRGVLVRHLILPGNVENSINALTGLFVEFGSGLPLSLMSQYHPALYRKDEDLNRFVSEEEFGRVYSHAIELGFEHLFVQFPDKDPGARCRRSSFFPDFRQTDPFKL